MKKIKKKGKISKINLCLAMAILVLTLAGGYLFWQNKNIKTPKLPPQPIDLTQMNDQELLKTIIPMAENFIQNFVSGDFNKASKDFNDEMKININTQNLEIIQGQILTKIGNLLNLGQPKITEKHTDFLFLEYPESKFAEEEKVLIKIVFKNDSQGNLKIAGFWLDSPKINSL